MALGVKDPPANAEDIRNSDSVAGSGRSPEEGMATHSSSLAWGTPWTEEPGRLLSVGSQRVWHNWSDLACSKWELVEIQKVDRLFLSNWTVERFQIKQFYEDLQDLPELTLKKGILFIIRDWIAKVGSQETPGVTGKFGLGVRNEAGQRLIEFCQENALVIANTLFQQHKRRLYTWT